MCWLRLNESPLRAPAASIPALSKALGVPLPQKPKTSALSKGNGIFGPRSKAGTRAALWLGPDEWLIIDEAGRDPKADCQPVRRCIPPSEFRIAMSAFRSRDRLRQPPSMRAVRKTCRLPPFRSGRVRAPSSARSRSCFGGPRMTSFASSAGAHSPTMCSHS